MRSICAATGDSGLYYLIGHFPRTFAMHIGRSSKGKWRKLTPLPPPSPTICIICGPLIYSTRAPCPNCVYTYYSSLFIELACPFNFGVYICLTTVFSIWLSIVFFFAVIHGRQLRRQHGVNIRIRWIQRSSVRTLWNETSLTEFCTHIGWSAASGTSRDGHKR